MLVVHGHSIEIGMTADDVFANLRPTELVQQEVKPDPNIPGSLRVTKVFKADGRTFTLVLARRAEVGPYYVIDIRQPGKAS
jgi:hypothetical protein